ncbi:hypothetical protein PPC_2629 [Pseudomonas protegens Cab57]|nr:hypothetical protein PPC_2629 [Pseudomonas protegens Cab57]
MPQGQLGETPRQVAGRFEHFQVLEQGLGQLRFDLLLALLEIVFRPFGAQAGQRGQVGVGLAVRRGAPLVGEVQVLSRMPAASSCALSRLILGSNPESRQRW